MVNKWPQADQEENVEAFERELPGVNENSQKRSMLKKGAVARA